MQTDILDRRPDNRQATALRREYINLVGALPHIDFPDFRWHWWSECIGASWQGTRKTSRGVLRPQPGFILLGERLVEAANGARDFEPLPAGFEPLPPPYGCSSQLRTSASIRSRNMAFILTVPVKRLGVESAFPIVFAP